MPYSAVTQPSPEPLLWGGTLSRMLAVHSTLVSPKAISTEPSACLVKALEIVTGRKSFGLRPLGRVIAWVLIEFCLKVWVGTHKESTMSL